MSLKLSPNALKFHGIHEIIFLTKGFVDRVEAIG
jgi:hypothetical protein